jgi:hypothetical protein
VSLYREKHQVWYVAISFQINPDIAGWVVLTDMTFCLLIRLSKEDKLDWLCLLGGLSPQHRLQMMQQQLKGWRNSTLDG